jgi:peptide chain release factor subunit 3
LDPSAGTDAKKPFNVVLLGHVDAGKSTISGHLLYLTGNVDERTMEKYEREAKALNRESWKFAWALDTSDQERAKGKTEEYGQAAFNSETRRFTILDAPGHKNYVPHMIGGASQADIGILVISARKGEFETGFERGGQTREHAMLAKTSGVRMLVVVINKLDDPSVLCPDGTWSQERYNDCKTGLEPYLRQVGWNLKEIIWIPVSGLQGDNLKVRVSEATCPWFRGPTLLEALENISLPDRLLTGPVKMSISEKHREMGTMVKGKLESGVIRLNDKLVMMPNGVDVVVDAVELEGSESTTAVPGDNVRLRLKGIDDEDIRTGFVLCSPNALVPYTNCFDAQLMILEHKSILCAGYSAVMHVHQVEVECTLEKLLAEVDRRTGKISKKNPKFVKPGMKCIARVQTQQPICIEPYKSFPQLGRFMLRDEGRTIAVGIVLKVRDSKGADTDAAAGGSQ